MWITSSLVTTTETPTSPRSAGGITSANLHERELRPALPNGAGMTAGTGAPRPTRASSESPLRVAPASAGIQPWGGGRLPPMLEGALS